MKNLKRILVVLFYYYHQKRDTKEFIKIDKGSSKLKEKLKYHKPDLK